MTHASDPKDALELLRLREAMRHWRFYDHFRTDKDAPARKPQVGTYTPVLSSDGADLAPAVVTLEKIGFIEDFNEALEDAFPGATLESGPGPGCHLLMHQQGLLRPLMMSELSDGTLRYLLLMTALHSPRPPLFMVLNEPEMSLHPDLLPALGRLIAKASERTQILVVSHSQSLVNALQAAKPTQSLTLEKVLGETQIIDADPPPWTWPSR